MSSVEIRNVGPIQRLSIPFPENGGLVCLVGPNGGGKTTAINAVQTLITGEGKIPVTWGESSAEVSGFGARLTMSAANNRKGHYGEFSVSNIEGDSALMDFVNPGVKDPVVADAKRIKAAIRVMGIPSDSSLFEPLFSSRGEMLSVVGSASLGASCPVEMCAGIKRDVEASARGCELLFQERKSQAEGLMRTIPLEFSGAIDETTIEDAEARLAAALENLSDLKVARRDSDAAAAERQRISESLKSVSRIDLSAIQAEGVLFANSVKEQSAIVTNLEETLEIAKQTLRDLETNLKIVRERYKNASEENARIESMEASLAADQACPVSDLEIENASILVSGLASLVESKKNEAAVMDNANRAKSLFFEAEEAKLSAERLRSIAGSLEKVLTSVLGNGGSLVFIEDGRLWTEFYGRKELFSGLSEGQKFRIAIRMCVSSLRERFPNQVPLCVIPQEAFEVLQPSVREEIARYAIEESVVVLTALPADGNGVGVSVYDSL